MAESKVDVDDVIERLNRLINEEPQPSGAGATSGAGAAWGASPASGVALAAGHAEVSPDLLAADLSAASDDDPPAAAVEFKGEARRVSYPPLPRTAALTSKEAAPAFFPRAPTSLQEAKLHDREVAVFILRLLAKLHHLSGRKIAEQIKLPFCLLESVLKQLKTNQLVIYKETGAVGDFIYQLTEKGHNEAERLTRLCSYYGSMPVQLSDYVASVHAQSVRRQNITLDDLNGALAGMLVNPVVFNKVGQALRAGRGFFIYGAPGNGKTMIAERIGRAYGQTIWIPRAISAIGEIIRLFDPCAHTEVPLGPGDTLTPQDIDPRWVRIRRPILIAGGELTMERLEITFNPVTGISEAPLQLKSNCGALVIDDFGRQRMSTADLLNRWIVPLDKQHDYLNLHNGQAIQVPFDQLLIFSTNLEPRDLVDEAFLRRMPYKIQVPDPNADDFRWLLRSYADQFKIAYSDEDVEHLISQHFIACGRQFRFCHARDLLLQVQAFCEFNNLPVAMSRRAFDVAASNYFAVMGG